MSLHFHLFLEGLGLAQRRRKFAEAWESHLAASRDAQILFASALSEKSVRGPLAILGAGRLHDCELEKFEKITSTVHLVDGDPGAWVSWFFVKSKPRLRRFCVEMTGALSRWKRELEIQVRGASWAEALKKIETIPGSAPVPARNPRWLHEVSSIVSLNLLSQLPLGWQDIVERTLQRQFGAQEVRARQEEWLQAYATGGAQIVNDHLRLLAQSWAGEVLIVCDLEFAEYELSVDPQELENQAEAPIAWRIDADGAEVWEEVEPDTVQIIEVAPALCGLEFEKVTRAIFSGWNSNFLEPWLWHIVPGGKGGRGKVHRVGAAILSRGSEH